MSVLQINYERARCYSCPTGVFWIFPLKQISLFWKFISPEQKKENGIASNTFCKCWNMSGSEVLSSCCIIDGKISSTEEYRVQKLWVLLSYSWELSIQEMVQFIFRYLGEIPLFDNLIALNPVYREQTNTIPNLTFTSWFLTQFLLKRFHIYF